MLLGFLRSKRMPRSFSPTTPSIRHSLTHTLSPSLDDVSGPRAPLRLTGPCVASPRPRLSICPSVHLSACPSWHVSPVLPAPVPESDGPPRCDTYIHSILRTQHTACTMDSYSPGVADGLDARSPGHGRLKSHGTGSKTVDPFSGPPSSWVSLQNPH